MVLGFVGATCIVNLLEHPDKEGLDAALAGWIPPDEKRALLSHVPMAGLEKDGGVCFVWMDEHGQRHMNYGVFDQP